MHLQPCICSHASAAMHLNSASSTSLAVGSYYCGCGPDGPTQLPVATSSTAIDPRSIITACLP